MRGQICQKWPGRASRSDHPVPLRALASLPFVSARYDNILAASCLDELRQNTSSTITASHIGMPSAYSSIHTPRILCVDCYSETGVGDLEVSHTGVSQCSVMMLHFAAMGGLLKRQQALAHKAEVDRSYLSRVEAAHHYVGLEVIGKIAEALEVEPAELLKLAARRRRS